MSGAWAALAAASLLLMGAARAEEDLPPAREAVDEALREITSYEHHVRRSTATAAQVELGKLLFFDPRLSRNGAVSCAACHLPDRAWSDGRALAKGLAEGPRNTPSLLTVAYYKDLTWDGRARTAAEAALAAIRDPFEMGADVDDVVAVLKRVPGYVKRFSDAYGRRGLAEETLGDALGAFALAQQAPEDSAFDRFLKDRSAMTAAQQRGLVLYASKAGCRNCHSSLAFADQRFRSVGVKRRAPVDLGRYRFDPRMENWEAFRTPTLRDAALTAPYMHDGSLKTLREVVDFYDRGGDASPNKDADLPRGLDLSAREKDDLVAFLSALTSSTRAVSVPDLPLAAEEALPGPSSPAREAQRAVPAPAAAADLEAAVRTAAELIVRTQALLDGFPRAKAGGAAYSDGAALSFCMRSPQTVQEVDGQERNFYRGCRALVRDDLSECRRMGLAARASLDDVNDCEGIAYDLGMTRAVRAEGPEAAHACARAILHRKPSASGAAVIEICRALRAGPDAAGACRAILAGNLGLFRGEKDCLHAFAMYYGEDCGSYGDFDYQKRLCAGAASFARASRGGTCDDYLCSLLSGYTEACEDRFHEIKQKACLQRVTGGWPARGSQDVEPFYAELEGAVLSAEDRPVEAEERQAVLRLHAALARPVELDLAAALADAVLLRMTHLRGLLFKAKTLSAELGGLRAAEISGLSKGCEEAQGRYAALAGTP
jgi:cytochrome c peroxidase